MLLVAVAPVVKQLAVPHSYPEGQHPAAAPSSLPHKNQPPAQVALLGVGVVGISMAGTTTVTPLETKVVRAGRGHEYV